MLKYEKVAKIGQRIRSYDHEPCVGRKDRYIEGVVIAITEEYGYKAFVVQVDVDSSDLHRVGKQFYVPMEMSFCDYEGRVINKGQI